MRLGTLLLSIAALALAAGCLKVDSGTTLKKDGSGTYVQTSTLEMKKAAEYQKMLLAKARSLGIPEDEEAENPYAALDAKERAALLKDRRGIRVIESTEGRDEAKQTRTYSLKVGFKSLYDLYESGVIDDMTAKLEPVLEGKAWKLTLRHVFDANDEDFDPEAPDGPALKRLRQVREALFKKVEPWWGTMEAVSKLTLPAKVLQTNGVKSEDGLSVTWKIGFKQLADPRNLMQTVTFENVKGLGLKAFHLTANDIENAREEAQMRREERRAKKK